MPSVQTFAFQVRAIWKRLTSLLKKDWTLSDYPVHTKFLLVGPSPISPRLKQFAWSATLINWPGMSGGGNTKMEALEALRKNFQLYKATNKQLPRPGSKVPMHFAATTRVDRHRVLAKDFVKRVLDLDWAWISDESSLDDFQLEVRDVEAGIREVYGVDVSDISSGNLADIFDRIESHAGK